MEENKELAKASDTSLPYSSTYNNFTIRLWLCYKMKEEENKEEDIIKAVPVEILKKGEIVIDSAVTQLKQRGYMLDGAKIWYYSEAYGSFIYCSTDPLPRSFIIDKIDQVSSSITLMAEMNPSEDNEVVESKVKSRVKIEQNNEETKGNVGTRVKERELSVIIAKVRKWRDLYYGYTDGEGNKVRFSLEEAADMVGLPKKTLDDYLQQLKIGKKYGFDFNINRHKKIGELRNFVKKFKTKETKSKREKSEDGAQEEKPKQKRRSKKTEP